VWKTNGRYLRELLVRAETLLGDASQPVPVRTASMTLLLHEQGPAAAAALLKLFKTGERPEIEQAAARALTSIPGEGTVRELLAPERWREFSPNTRAAVLGSVLAQPRHIATLLDQLESGTVLPSAINRAQRDRLLKHRDEPVRVRAGKLFATVGGDRMKIYEERKAALQLPARALSGREVFKTHCASCHRLEREGFAVGPDLFGIRNQAKESLLLHVVVPNYEINADFVGYEVQTRDERTLTGLVASETANSITVRQPNGIEETLRRTEIVALRASTVSLMPDELEQAMTQQDLADLLAFLKGE
jgi:putative heme-binding domain-containing protein